MTELENDIYECMLRILPYAKKRVKEIESETQARYIEIPFYCDGCFDSLVYDKDIKKFTKIKYAKGKGDVTILEGMSEFSGYFKSVENCEIDITGLINT